MKRKEFLLEIEKMNESELREKVRSLMDEALKLRVRHASNQLETSHRLKETDRHIARALTKLNSLKNQSHSAEVSA